MQGNCKLQFSYDVNFDVLSDQNNEAINLFSLYFKSLVVKGNDDFVRSKNCDVLRTYGTVSFTIVVKPDKKLLLL